LAFDVEVTVPATAANLGPGFDCLGVALGTYLKVRFTQSDESEIKGKGQVRSVADSLIFRSFSAGFEAVGMPPPSVCVDMLEVYPSARGLGASASAIVSGLIAARACGDLDLRDEALTKLAVQIEGHADNVLPALLGGLVLSSEETLMRFEPTPDISPLILVSGKGFKTEAARRVVPAEVSRHDAVENAAATAALVAILSGSSPPHQLLQATGDRLHEPYRLPLMPETLRVHTGLRARGIPTALSGAGPSLICLVETSNIDAVARKARELLPNGWSLLMPGWDLKGGLAVRLGG